MRLRAKLAMVAMILLMPISIFLCIYIIDNSANQDKNNPYVNKVNIKEIIKNNFVPGKEEALNNAKRYLSYAEYGCGYSESALKDELSALGYPQEDIDYAISQIPKTEYINQVIDMYKAYDVKPTLEQAIDMWTDIGFTEKQIRKAFKFLT